MYTKYEIKSYPNNNSDVEKRKNYFQYKNKDYTNSENNKIILETTFQPKCIFTKQNDNISFYQSSTKYDFKNSKKREENKIQNITPIIKDKNKIYTIPNSNERKEQNEIQNFSYNYSEIIENKNKNRNRTIKNNINNINVNINPNNNNYNFNTNSEYYNENEKKGRINLNENIIKKNKKKRITKSCKRQFNVQKGDTFNVLSYKQPEYDSDKKNTNLNKNKIIQIYKKQGVEEIFFPSKRSHSPAVPTKIKEVLQKYQSHTLKYQSFFGSFNSNSSQQKMVKSYSRTKVNQLNDFNIDKLIEIGDKYVSMMKPPLPLGKILNNNIINFNNKIKKNKFQIPINTNNNCFNFSKYSKRTFNKQLEDNKENIPLLINEKNRVIKKLTSKNNIKNSKLLIDKENEEDNQKYPNENTVRKFLNFKNENKKINDIMNTNNNSSVVIRRRNKNNNNEFLRKKNSFDNNYVNDLGEEIAKRKVQKIEGDLRINTNNNITPKYIILNKSRRQRETKEEKLMTEEVNNYRTNRNNEEKKSQNNNRKILIDINVSKKYNKYKNEQKRQNKRNNYYGYDDRHNLEDKINNHSYYESLHSNKSLNNNIYNKIV